MCIYLLLLHIKSCIHSFIRSSWFILMIFLKLCFVYFLAVSTASALGHKEETFLFISIFSAYNNRLKRDAVRETWLRQLSALSTPAHPIRYMFILAKQTSLSPSQDASVLEEMKRHRDIYMLSSEKEDYLNLMPKLRASIQMAFGTSAYLLKTDDDSLVDLGKIVRILKDRRTRHEHSDPLYYGKIDVESKLVIKDLNYTSIYGADFMDCVERHIAKSGNSRCAYVEDLVAKKYGFISTSRYAHGAGYIVGAGLGVPLKKVSLGSVDTPHEDHSLGQWIQHLDQKLGVAVDYQNDNGILDWTECSEYMGRTIIHRLPPERMRCIWSVISSLQRPRFGQHRTCCK